MLYYLFIFFLLLSVVIVLDMTQTGEGGLFLNVHAVYIDYNPPPVGQRCWQNLNFPIICSLN